MLPHGTGNVGAQTGVASAAVHQQCRHSLGASGLLLSDKEPIASSLRVLPCNQQMPYSGPGACCDNHHAVCTVQYPYNTALTIACSVDYILGRTMLGTWRLQQLQEQAV